MATTRSAFPSETQDQDAFVLGHLVQVHNGVFSYNKLCNKRELCEGFWVRKRDFTSLHDTISRLVDQGTLSRDVKVVRPTQRQCGYTNPASRAVTLTVKRSVTTDSNAMEHEYHFS